MKPNLGLNEFARKPPPNPALPPNPPLPKEVAPGRDPNGVPNREVAEVEVLDAAREPVKLELARAELPKREFVMLDTARSREMPEFTDLAVEGRLDAELEAAARELEATAGRAPPFEAPPVLDAETFLAVPNECHSFIVGRVARAARAADLPAFAELRAADPAPKRALEVGPVARPLPFLP
ncbi:MAG: hypothetical protein WBP79_13130 [Candidatus Acidiferrales bacterium]